MRKLSHESKDMVKATASPIVASKRLLGDIRLLIESAKSHLAQTANSVLVALYWNIGKRIKTEILGNERAQYGKEIVSTLQREYLRLSAFICGLNPFYSSNQWLNFVFYY